ncbi:hypothetical protein TYRP_009461 [Tyrophagus putrescentiae]|nr:hypothetical protein TYRP_009461 [Tyrophagus putrescentiae]
MRGGGRDWDDRYPNYELGGGHHSGGGGGGHYGGSSGGGGYPHHRDEDELHQPPMLTLKQFLLDQDDNIDEETLLKKYNDYKSDFRRTQLQEFFNRHKDEEWFRVKYFPDEIAKRKERQGATNARRLAVFMKLHEDKWFDGISLDVDQADAIVRVMDAVAIMLEGGTDFDLKAIDEAAAEEAGGLPRPKDGPGSIFAVESASGSKASGVVVAPKAIDLNLAEQQQQQASSASSAKGNDSGLEEESAKSPEGEGTTATEAGGGSQEEDLAQQKSPPPKASEDNGTSAEAGELEEGEEAASVNDSNDDRLDAGELADSSDGMSFGGQPKEKTATTAAAEEAPKPRALHKTCSIFFRNLAPSVTRAEIEEECKKFPGFLRLSISEAQADRKFARRGWATYERTVPIREICWALNSVKIRGTELGPIVNRDLTRRIRSVNGISSHKTVVRADIRHAAKLIMKLDAEKGLWPAEGSAETTTSSSAAENTTTTSTSEHTVGSNGNGGGENHSAPPPSLILSRNPLLKNIADYLIEEASAEEEELLGGRPVDGDGSAAAMDTLNADGEGAVAADEEGGAANGNSANGSNNGSGGALGGVKLERDEALLAYLDRLLLYLRIVHSTDYYSSSEYPQEDEMPNRIGLIHARGLFSSARVAASEVSEYMREVEGRVAGALGRGARSDARGGEAAGPEGPGRGGGGLYQAKGKWLCPLSNKKFMGPEFVRKHILNKHMERVEQVREEALYFNNYVLDAKRPQLPEHPSAGGGHDRGGSGRHSGGGGMMSNSGGGYSRDHRGDMHGGLSGGGGHYGDRYGGGGYNRHSYGNNRYSGGGGENRYGMKRSRPDYGGGGSGSYHQSHSSSSSAYHHHPHHHPSSSSARDGDAMAPPPPPPSASPVVTSTSGGGRSSLGGGRLVAEAALAHLLATRHYRDWDAPADEM